MRLLRQTVLILMLPSLVSCSWVEGEREEAADAARQETLAEVEGMLAEAVRTANRTAGSADRILSPMPVMTPAEEARLRRYLNASHVASARRNGVRALDAETVGSLIEAGRLVALEDSTRYWIVRPRSAPTHVVPEMRALLEILALRFQERLAALDLPPYRIEVTSALRTAARQARLRGSNANAASGVSSHEFGTTVDLSYAAFAPPYETPDALPPGAPDAFRPHVERLMDLALESVSARKSRELGKIFSEVLARAQDEGIALVIYERQQTVYHVTVGDQMIADTQGAPE
ncbi:MAG: DUF5715 family protein [Gemmatimonadota bacterium]